MNRIWLIYAKDEQTDDILTAWMIPGLFGERARRRRNSGKLVREDEVVERTRELPLKELQQQRTMYAMILFLFQEHD